MHAQLTPQKTELTELILKAKVEFEQAKGNLTKEKLTLFSIWTCDRFKPQWQQGNETGYYTPSAIKGLASKLFGLTPAVQKIAQD